MSRKRKRGPELLPIIRLQPPFRTDEVLMTVGEVHQLHSGGKGIDEWFRLAGDRETVHSAVAFVLFFSPSGDATEDRVAEYVRTVFADETLIPHFALLVLTLKAYCKIQWSTTTPFIVDHLHRAERCIKSLNTFAEKDEVEPLLAYLLSDAASLKAHSLFELANWVESASGETESRFALLPDGSKTGLRDSILSKVVTDAEKALGGDGGIEVIAKCLDFVAANETAAGTLLQRFVRCCLDDDDDTVEACAKPTLLRFFEIFHQSFDVFDLVSLILKELLGNPLRTMTSFFYSFVMEVMLCKEYTAFLPGLAIKKGVSGKVASVAGLVEKVIAEGRPEFRHVFLGEDDCVGILQVYNSVTLAAVQESEGVQRNLVGCAVVEEGAFVEKTLALVRRTPGGGDVAHLQLMPCVQQVLLLVAPVLSEASYSLVAFQTIQCRVDSAMATTLYSISEPFFEKYVLRRMERVVRTPSEHFFLVQELLKVVAGVVGGGGAAGGSFARVVQALWECRWWCCGCDIEFLDSVRPKGDEPDVTTTTNLTTAESYLTQYHLHHGADPPAPLVERKRKRKRTPAYYTQSGEVVDLVERDELPNSLTLSVDLLQNGFSLGTGNTVEYIVEWFTWCAEGKDVAHFAAFFPFARNTDAAASYKHIQLCQAFNFLLVFHPLDIALSALEGVVSVVLAALGLGEERAAQRFLCRCLLLCCVDAELVYPIEKLAQFSVFAGFDQDEALRRAEMCRAAIAPDVIMPRLATLLTRIARRTLGASTGGKTEEGEGKPLPPAEEGVLDAVEEMVGSVIAKVWRRGRKKGGGVCWITKKGVILTQNMTPKWKGVGVCGFCLGVVLSLWGFFVRLRLFVEMVVMLCRFAYFCFQQK